MSTGKETLDRRCKQNLPSTILAALLLLVGSSASLSAADSSLRADLLIRHGTILDGTGVEAFTGDVAIRSDRILGVYRDAAPEGMRAKKQIDATGLAVAPGFINMLSQSDESLIIDGRSQSEIRQGVTLEILGEGSSMGPLNPAMKRAMVDRQGDLKYPVNWTTLAQFLDHLEHKGVSPNVASFVGAASLRIHELDYANRAPTPEELERMLQLARQAMRDGALGVSSALIYTPGFFAQTDELIALARVAGEFGGIYISHIRSEGNRFLEALDECLQIAREAKVPAEIYHLKAAGQQNWDKLAAAIEKIEAARRDGQRITADMYTYTAAGTGLDAAMPPWVQEGGFDAWAKRLQDPAIRERVRREMSTPTDQWENLLLAAGSPEKVLLVGFRNPALKSFTGKTLAQVAAIRGKSPEETAMDLVVGDGSRIGTIYFLMSEDNVRRQIALPWVSFGSDEASMAHEGNFLKSNPHPRAYGNFARLLGKYVRDEKLITLTEAIRKLTFLPATNLKLDHRGALQPGYYADVVVFDPATIADHATFERPHQYATGMRHVFVNGIQVLRDGEHTGALPGRVVRGPGWKKKD